MQPYLKKIVTPEQLLECIGAFPRTKKAGMACGCWDLVHPGHHRHLSYIKSKVDILVVMVTADRFINKGVLRPHIPEQLRAESLAALEFIDYVVIDQNSSNLINVDLIKPEFFCKGYEYEDMHHLATAAETKLVENYGGQMLFTPGDTVFSSTKLLNANLPDLRIDKLLNLMKIFGFSFNDLRNAISEFHKFKAHVVGDCIVDTYTRTRLIGSNAKTPTFSVLYDKHDDYVGGAAIVAQHLKAAGADVTLSTVLGDDAMGELVSARLQETKIKGKGIIDNKRPTTHKNAIIASDYRLLKIDVVDNAALSAKALKQLASEVADIPTDCVIFSDFRHGIFSKATIPVLASVIPLKAFKVADSQVASRWGNITEFNGFDLITPNEKEARFALGDQDSNIGHLITATRDAAQCQNIILKLGSRGIFFLQDDYPYSLDSFARCVKDAVGAGDALLAYATLAMLATKSLPMACIIGSMAAACECEYDGNIPITPQAVLKKLEEVEGMI